MYGNYTAEMHEQAAVKIAAMIEHTPKKDKNERSRLTLEAALHLKCASLMRQMT